MPPRIGNARVTGSTRAPERLRCRFRGEVRTEFGHRFPGCAAVGTQPGEMLPVQRHQTLEAGIAEHAIAVRRRQVGTRLSHLQPQASQLGELLFIARPDLDKPIGDEEDRTRRGLWLSSGSREQGRGDAGCRIIAPRCSPGSLSDDSRIASSNSIDHELVPFLRSG